MRQFKQRNPSQKATRHLGTKPSKRRASNNAKKDENKSKTPIRSKSAAKVYSFSQNYYSPQCDIAHSTVSNLKSHLSQKPRIPAIKSNPKQSQNSLQTFPFTLFTKPFKIFALTTRYFSTIEEIKATPSFDVEDLKVTPPETPPFASDGHNHPNTPPPAPTTIHLINGQPKAKLSERDKMTLGQEFNVRDVDLAKARTRAKTISLQFNSFPLPFLRQDKQHYTKILKELFINMDKSAYIIGPVTVDYGFNVYIGQNSFLNSNITLLDVAPIRIGSHVMIGPNVDIYTASHGIDWKKRRDGYTIGKEVVIGDDVWIGGRVVILPGVKIGPRSIIGAGSVVTKDVESDVFVVGNPAVVKMKLLSDEEREAAKQTQM